MPTKLELLMAEKEKRTGGANRLDLLLAEKQKRTGTGGRGFLEKAREVATGTLAAGASLITGKEPEAILRGVGETGVDIAATGAIPVRDPEAFRETPVFEAGISMAGELGGAAVGGIPGAAIGGGIGGGFGRAIDEGIRAALGVSDVQGLSDLAKKIGISTGIGTAGSLIPAALSPLAKKLLAPFKGTMSERAKQALVFSKKHGDIVEEVFGRRDVMPFLPAEGTDISPTSSFAKLLDTAQNMIEKSIFGGGPIVSRRIGNAKVNEIVLRRTIDAIDVADLGPTELGNILRSAAEGRDKILNGVINRRYTAVNARVKDITKKVKLAEIAPEGVAFRPEKEVGIVRMLEPKIFAKKVSDLGKKVNGIGDSEQGFDVANKLLNLLEKDQGHVDYETAQLLRSTYATKLRNREIAKETGPINRTLKELIARIDSSIKTALKTHDPKALEIWETAKNLRLKRGKEFQNDLITKLLDTAPNQSMQSSKDFVDSFLGTGDVLDVDKIRTIKAAVGEKAFKKAKRFITQRMLLESAEPGISRVAISEGQLGKETGEGLLLKGTALEEALLGKRGMGKEVLKEIYTPQELATLKNVANSLAVSQAKQGEGTGGMFIQLAQGGAVLGVGGLKKAASVLMIPPIISKLMLNPTSARWFTEGFAAPAGSKQAIQAFAKISGAVANLKKEEQSRVIRTRNRRQEIIFTKGGTK